MRRNTLLDILKIASDLGLYIGRYNLYQIITKGDKTVNSGKVLVLLKRCPNPAKIATIPNEPPHPSINPTLEAPYEL